MCLLRTLPFALFVLPSFLILMLTDRGDSAIAKGGAP